MSCWLTEQNNFFDITGAHAVLAEWPIHSCTLNFVISLSSNGGSLLCVIKMKVFFCITKQSWGQSPEAGWVKSLRDPELFQCTSLSWLQSRLPGCLSGQCLVPCHLSQHINFWSKYYLIPFSPISAWFWLTLLWSSKCVWMSIVAPRSLLPRWSTPTLYLFPQACCPLLCCEWLNASIPKGLLASSYCCKNVQPHPPFSFVFKEILCILRISLP